MDEPLRPPDLRRVLRKILEDGEVVYSEPHAHERMEKHGISIVDCENALQGGMPYEGEWENGAWRYQVHTGKFCIVVQLLSKNEVLIVTAWRKGR